MATTTIIPEVEKEIKFNRETKDYDLYITIDGQREYIGSAASYSEGESKCRDFAYSYYEDNHTPEKAIQVALADEHLPDGLRIAGEDEPGWTYRTPTGSLWVTDAPPQTRDTEAASEPLVTVERHWSDKDESPDAPPEGASVWTDYECGDVVIGIGESDYVNDMHIAGVKLEGEIVTLAALTQIHADLGHLLADARVRAALPSGADLSYVMPPARMVRVKDFKANCSFPLAVGLNVGCAIERARRRIGLTREQMFDVVIAANQVIEDMFDLSVGMGILGNNPTKLADAAYQQGFREAIDAFKGFLELREKAPDKAAALVGKAA